MYVFVAVIWMACLGLMATDVSGAGEDPNVLQGNLAESFRIALDSIEFSARTSLLSENGEMVCALPERRLTFSLRYERCGSDMPIGVDTNPPTILRVFDETGHAVDCRIESADGMRKYEELRWENGWAGEEARLLPSGLAIDLVLDPNQPTPSCLSLVEGYVYVLCAGEIIEGDVPFEINGKWFDAERNLHISICPETPPTPGPIQFELVPTPTDPAGRLRPTAPVALWEYETRVHSASGRVLPLGRLWVSHASVDDYVLIKTQLIEVKGSVTFITEVSNQVSHSGYYDDCLCGGKIEQSYSDYDHIRHVIAVAPVEVKVPFVLTDIPIPSFQAVAK
ncbi:MAG: hypothetical protein RBS72_05980 [Sedimentisphaerales bacterium]|nr:hypothetical protein [Sedimentisphaerales bacterium]HNY79874.1 hypothetical protein [Sedimentisphaerales bacterium]HQA90524.1 hypothetical protein [Sedimentisphaerales bacterium]